MRILGIDPALNSLGFGIIEIASPKIRYINSGMIKTKSSEEMHKRLGFISSQIHQVIEQYQPNAIAMEITFLNNNAVSSLKLAYVRGAIMAIVGQLGIPYYEYAPNQIKKSVVGSGHAEKQQLKSMMQMILTGNVSDITFDESDALAVAYTCAVSTRW